MVLIGICGKKFSGKDTIADYLVQNYGFVKLSYAQPLKKIAQELFLFSDKQLHNPSLKEKVDSRWGISPRDAFQMIGTNWVRNQLNKDFWVQRLRWEIDKYPKGTNIVVPDVRFENEKQLILDLGGILIGVQRQYSEDCIDSHESEINICHLMQGIPLFENNGDKESLFLLIQKWIKEEENFFADIQQ